MLRFLRRQIRYRIKKRTFVVLAIALTVTFLVAALVAMIAVWLAGPSDELRIEITQSDRRDRLLGVGADISALPVGNFLVDSSFEPVTFREMLTVYEGDEQTLTVSETDLNQSLFSDGFFDGATARVLTPSADSMTLRKIDTVSTYGINRVGQFQAVLLPADLPLERQIFDFADNESISLAVGTGGLILRDLVTAEPSVVESGLTSDLSGITAYDQGFLACSLAGDVIFSNDGQMWTGWPILEPRPLRAIAASADQLVVAVGDNGFVLTGTNGVLSQVPAPIQSDLIDVVFNDGIFLAMSRDGTVLRSTTGTFWEIVHEATYNQTWRAIDSRDGIFALAGDGGHVLLSQDGYTFTPTEAKADGDLRDIVLLSPQQIIVVSQDNLFQYTNDGGQTWAESTFETGMYSTQIALLNDRHIISTDNVGQLGLAPLVLEIKLDNPLVSGTFAAGDLLYLEKSLAELPSTTTQDSPDVSTAGWELFGAGKARRTTLSAPDAGGRASLHIQADAGVILSQAIDPTLFVRNRTSEIYQLEWWMRQSNIPDAALKVWLSGDFDSIGTTVDRVGSTWKRYTHTFVLPSTQLAKSNEVRLNISFDGPGELWLDQIFLGNSIQKIHGLDENLAAALAKAAPSAIRLSGLQLGSSLLATEQWATPAGNDAPVFQNQQWSYPSGQSLATAFDLTQVAGSDPWLVLDSSMGESELLHLLEYIAGPVTTPFGQIRLNQGQIVPYNEIFNHIYLEIRDSENRFDADYLRADYVDWLINVASQSTYYNDLKKQLVFIDGMQYSDGVWRSSADYHVSAMQGEYENSAQNGIKEAVLRYYDLLPRNPSQSRQGVHELISPLTLTAPTTNQPLLADWVTLSLTELGQSAALANIAWPVNPAFDSASQTRIQLATQMAAQTQDHIVLDTIRAESDLQVFAYRQDDTYLVIIANTGIIPLNARISGLIDSQNTEMQSFDQDGDLLRERQIRRANEQLTVLPGGVVILKKTA
ncbi:MAG: hypothetical protein PHC86_08690 [Eubacteriales bacterium]|nr:hypothetical protein [Eubacteriales bacterium]